MAQAPQEIVQTRRVGEQERLFHYLHAAGGLIATGAAHIRGPLSPELVRRAFDWLQRQHPILKSHIRYEGYAYSNVPPFAYPIPWFDTRGTTEIPIRVVTDPDPEAWRPILEKEGKTPIGRGKHPRVRVVLVRAHEGADLNHLITTFDHAIMDAQAGSMLNDQLFRYFANPDEMEKQAPVWNGIPPSLESGLPKKPDSGKTYQPAIRFPKTPVPNPERVGRNIDRHIGANEGEALRAAIRAHRTTMHGAIGAAFLTATREKFGLDEMTILSTVELRRMMKPPLPVSAFGCYIDILRTRHDLSDDFWAMAADLSFKLISAIARDQQSASIMKLATWEVYRKETIPTLTHRRRIDGIAMTTAGEASFNGTGYGPFMLDGSTGTVSVSMFGPSIFVVSFEKDGAIDLSIGYSADALSLEDVNDLADRAVAALSRAAATTVETVAIREQAPAK